MKANYKNWVPKNMVVSFYAGAGVLLIVTLATLLFAPNIKWLIIVLAILTLIVLCGAIFVHNCYNVFSYDGKMKLSKKIISSVCQYVDVKDNAKVLDVGCGSGALSIAVAKKNKKANVTGIDRWGKEYASFSKKLCEDNSKAEGVSNTEFMQGDATKLPFKDESFDVLVSNYVYHNIPSSDRKDILLESLRVVKKGGTFAIHDIFTESKYGDMDTFVKKLKDMGYEKVEFVPTGKGLFYNGNSLYGIMINGSHLLYGKK